MGTEFLNGRNIAVGVGGGIAAYKTGDFIRELRRQGAQVRVAMTKAAIEFITPLTLQGLSGHQVLTDIFDPKQDAGFGHLELSRWADVFVIAPATADLMARIVEGVANDAVTTSLIAFRGPVLLAPAMNTAMWDHAATQRHVKQLLADQRYRLVGPGVGALADGDVGAGRLAELNELIAATNALSNIGPLAGKKVLVTAGPTREALDPVRFISNPSSGKMGIELARVARARGAAVTVILGPTDAVNRQGLDIVDVVTADEMHAAVMQRVSGVDAFFAVAAVSDWKAAVVSTQKVKKSEGPVSIELVRTVDVLASASAQVHTQAKRPLLVGFAAETNDVETYALQKLQQKQLDVIVANDVSSRASGFGADQNAVQMIAAGGERRSSAGPKRQVAQDILDFVTPLLAKR